MTFHVYQYAAVNSPITRTAGCTWVTGATGVAIITGGRYTPTPDKIHSLVKRTEETSPATPGWSLPDLKLALQRYGAIRFEIHTGEGWSAVEAARAERRFLVIQGDSDVFPDGCSGAFDGAHCIGVDGSKVKTEAGVDYWWVHDPICPTGRWERKGVIRRYAEKLLSGVYFGYFIQKVPAPTWTWQYDAPGTRRGRFATFTVEDGRITGHEWVSTRTSAEYRCSAPDTYPWPGHTEQRLVKLGLLASGRQGPHTGKYVNARYASKENA